MSKVYQITAERCQESIDKVVNGVCPGCGGKVTPIETIDNSGAPTYWAGCDHCSVFTYPVKPKLYRTAQMLIDDGEFRYNSRPYYNASEEELEYWRTEESMGLCSRIQKYVMAYENNDGGEEQP